MKPLALLLLASALSASAASFTLDDPFGVGTPDVIGNPLAFDIQKGVFDFGPTSTTIRLYFNFGPDNTSTSPFPLNPSLPIIMTLGDLFLSGPGFNYGIALQTHDTPVSGNVTGGVLYQINNGNGVLTASQALGDPGITYRPDSIVWLNNSVGGALTPLLNATVNITGGGDGTTNAEFLAEITFSYAAGSQIANNLNGSPDVHFAIATCANDVLDTPEPASWALFGAGLIGVGLIRRRKEV